MYVHTRMSMKKIFIQKHFKIFNIDQDFFKRINFEIAFISNTGTETANKLSNKIKQIVKIYHKQVQQQL